MAEKLNENTPSERESLNEIKYSVAAIRKIILIQFVLQIIAGLLIWGSLRH
jgi:hypothetical protein